MKDAISELSDAMKPAAESGSAQHARHQRCLLHKCAGRFEVAAKVKCRCKSSGDDFSVSKLAAAVINMANSFKQIIGDTVERDNIVEHDPLLNSIGVGSEGIFSFSKSFAKCSTSNLG
jgi:dihydroorotase